MAFEIGEGCQIHSTAVINVESGFLGAGSIVNEGARIEGTHVEIGREAYIDRHATIGGGSCFDPQASLIAGDWFHMGVGSQLNTARGIRIGHEFGGGIETKIFTHGAYIDSYTLGAPTQWAGVEIGDNVWLPNAWVNPGVVIGSNVVVAARSLINKNIPSGAMAGGTPCKVIRENYLPTALTESEKQDHVRSIFNQALLRYEKSEGKASQSRLLLANDIATLTHDEKQTEFNLIQKTISGATSTLALIFKDQLRRNGLRFRFRPDGLQWRAWGSNPLQFF